MTTSFCEIDLEAINNNLQNIKKKVKSSKILVPVKADAYGHGLIPVSRFLEKKKVDYLGVAYASEGVKLRQAGIRTPILVFGELLGNDFELVFRHKLTPSILSANSLNKLVSISCRKKQKLAMHLDVDTGMGRLGFTNPEELFSCALTIKRNKYLILEGIYTHLSSADDVKSNYTLLQLDKFNKILREMDKLGINIPLIHAASSSAILNYPGSYYTMVRPGIILYGYASDNKPVRKLKIIPSMSLKSKVTFIKTVNPGSFISYGRTYKTGRKSVIATVGIGYADGYSRLLSNKARAIIKEEYANIVGRICMDQILVDVTGIKGVKSGDEVVLFGRSGNKTITVEEIAHLQNTITYEVVTRLGPRVEKFYKPVARD